MHQIDFLKILPDGEDNFAFQRSQQREQMARLPVDMNAILSDKERRYQFARSIDILDVGTELGKHDIMHAIDFLEIIPYPSELQQNSQFLNGKYSGEVNDRYFSDLEELKKANKNLAHFYAATNFILESRPEVAQIMNIVMSYEIESTTIDALAKKSHKRNAITTPECHFELESRYNPDVFLQLPVYSIKQLAETAVVEDFMDEEVSSNDDVIRGSSQDENSDEDAPNSGIHKITIDMRKNGTM